MRFMKTSLRIITIFFFAAIGITPAFADSFKPMKFMQEASAISAIASAVAQLEGCENDLIFSEKTKKGEDGPVITVFVTCNKLPGDNGKTERSTVGVELEYSRDGSVGSPLGFSYD